MPEPVRKATVTYAVAMVLLMVPINALLNGGFPPWAVLTAAASYIAAGTFLTASAVTAMRIANRVLHEEDVAPTKEPIVQAALKHWRPVGMIIVGALALFLTDSPLTERASAAPLIALLLFAAATGEWLNVVATRFVRSLEKNSSHELSEQLQKELRAVTRTTVLILFITFIAIDLVAVIGS